MRTSTIVMIAFAVLFGLLAVFLAQTWLNNQAEQRMRSIEAQQQAGAAGAHDRRRQPAVAVRRRA